MESKLIITNKETLKDKIYTIRGQKIMVDSDLAQIYGYTTKAFNQQVKNNINKFDNDFRFQLTKNEFDEILRSKNLTSSWGGRRYNVYAFTEQGIYMLMTVLKGELATKQSKALIKLFKEMKDYIIENDDKYLLLNNRLLEISIQNNKNTEDIKEIKEKIATKDDLRFIMENFIDKDKYKETLILNGEIVESDICYSNIYSLAKKSIYIIDNYINLKTLVLFKNIKSIDITIFSDNINKGLHKEELQDFIKEYPSINIKFKRTSNKFHDRFIILDYNEKSERIFHAGSSSKDSGKRITTIIEIENTKVYHKLIDNILNNEELIIK